MQMFVHGALRAVHVWSYLFVVFVLYRSFFFLSAFCPYIFVAHTGTVRYRYSIILVLSSLSNNVSDSDNSKILQAVTLTRTHLTPRHAVRGKHNQPVFAQSEVVLSSNHPRISLAMNLTIAT